jgi:hypothetical protein
VAAWPCAAIVTNELAATASFARMFMMGSNVAMGDES